MCAGVRLRTSDTDIGLGRGFWLIGRRRCLKLGSSVPASTCARAVSIGYVLIKVVEWVCGVHFCIVV